MTTTGEPFRTRFYGEVAYLDDGVYDLGAVCDETLFYLREELESRLAGPRYYDCHQHRDDDKEALGFVEDEIYWRWRTGGSLDEDLDSAVICRD